MSAYAYRRKGKKEQSDSVLEIVHNESGYVLYSNSNQKKAILVIKGLEVGISLEEILTNFAKADIEDHYGLIVKNIELQLKYQQNKFEDITKRNQIDNQELLKLREELTKIKIENIESSNENKSLKTLLNELKSGSKSLYQYRLDEITGLSASESINDLDISIFNEILTYITLLVENKFNEHWQVNNLISKRNLWYKYPNIRSINTHKNGSRVKGIRPEYYALVCEILEITGDGGTPLISSIKY
ncbi:hypothetical protein [Photobacterium carnosum]|uniref:hypothetical protein n=1 Tax=Photobacterium carnosum TaxID=2023717 RepID=UPI001E2F9282|nr:hypothetical protein [Photobacterium carnosum]MCD9500384.1 hypothetical protein [Photobacterium carnosum]